MSESSAQRTLSSAVHILSGFAFSSAGFDSIDGLPLVRIRDLGGVTTAVRFKGTFDRDFLIRDGDILIGMDGDFEVHRWLGGEALLNQRVCKVEPISDEIDRRFLFWYLKPNVAGIHRKAPQTTVRHLSAKDLAAIVLPSIDSDCQRVVGRILDTLDTAIHETEALIAKLKAVKQGLLHDLLTRGIDANGELRPTQPGAPHLYKASPLGWIPKEWSVELLGELAESLVDGPFGSNLKTAHYVENPGVRVVRLQNIGAGSYNDSVRAFVSESRAASLLRNRVISGDVLIASLGDELHPVGRACLYPDGLPDAINKADCFRFRSGSRCLNDFILYFLNGDAARRQARGYEQGVTMKRINLGNLRRIRIALPAVGEQETIVERMTKIDSHARAVFLELDKLQSKKKGLMDDLLTGRVRVAPLLDAATA